MLKSHSFAAVLLILFINFGPLPAFAHEAWLLTQEEVQMLSVTPVPEIFFNRKALSVLAIVSATLVFSALTLAQLGRATEDRLFAPLVRASSDLGPLVLRLGLGLSIGLSALGALPRHGTARWTKPTLFVPDMQFSLVQGWDWLVPIALITAIGLLLGLVTRLAALLVIALALAGTLAFTGSFLWFYALHFIAPALLLIFYGGGRFGCDPLIPLGIPPRSFGNPAVILLPVQIMTGIGFATIAICVKFLQPMLLIAILNHGNLNFLNMPQPVAALIMMTIELLAGCLFGMGLLIRPIAAFLIGAFTFFAITLQESPFLHANLYGLCLFFLMNGGQRSSLERVVSRSERRLLRRARP